MKKATCLFAAALLAMANGCRPPNPSTDESAENAAGDQDMKQGISRSDFGYVEGKTVSLYTLNNGNGVVATITDYGATVVSLEAPDRDGNSANLVLGFDTLEEYINDTSYFGCVAGRYANRIAEGKFRLDGTEYTLAQNNGPNHLHGGDIGFNKKLWVSEEVSRDGAVGVRMTYRSPDGEEGYPGNLDCTLTYWLTDAGELQVDYEAVTDKPTVANLTHHGYFNLAGAGSGPITDHEIVISADRFTPVSPTLIPTGELAPVEGTPLDFRIPKRIGQEIDSAHEQIVRGEGIDHNFVVRNATKDAPVLAAMVREPESGRVMEVLTTEPGLQFYTGNFIPDGTSGRDGQTYDRRGAFCLEAQFYPDSPNHPDFPSATLKPGNKYTQTTIYRFTTD